MFIRDREKNDPLEENKAGQNQSAPGNVSREWGWFLVVLAGAAGVGSLAVALGQVGSCGSVVNSSDIGVAFGDCRDDLSTRGGWALVLVIAFVALLIAGIACLRSSSQPIEVVPPTEAGEPATLNSEGNLRSLVSLHEQGALSDQEFAEAKERLVDNSRPGSLGG